MKIHGERMSGSGEQRQEEDSSRLLLVGRWRGAEGLGAMRWQTHTLLVQGVLAFGVLTYGVSVEGTPAREEHEVEERGLEENVVFDFEPASEGWQNIDDPVMGGRSRSVIRLAGGSAVFEGVVSLENNGGSASLRSPTATYDLHGFDGVALRVFGDGKTYGVRLRTNDAFDGVAYQAELATEPGRWSEVRLPFEGFRPVFRGRLVDDYPPLDPAAIKTFGLIIADRQEGPFRLEIDWIKSYREVGRPLSGNGGWW